MAWQKSEKRTEDEVQIKSPFPQTLLQLNLILLIQKFNFNAVSDGLFSVTGQCIRVFETGHLSLPKVLSLAVLLFGCSIL